MKAKYNGLYNFMIDNEGKVLSNFTLKEIGTLSGISHPQQVKNGIDYLISNYYLSLKPGLIIETHDGTVCETFFKNIHAFISEYQKMKTALLYIKNLTLQ